MKSWGLEWGKTSVKGRDEEKAAEPVFLTSLGIQVRGW